MNEVLGWEIVAEVGVNVAIQPLWVNCGMEMRAYGNVELMTYARVAEMGRFGMFRCVVAEDEMCDALGRRILVGEVGDEYLV